MRNGDSILVRIQRPTDIPLESLHGQRDNLGRSMRLTVANVVPADSLGEFSLEAQQGEVAAVFAHSQNCSRISRSLVGEHPSCLHRAQSAF